MKKIVLIGALTLLAACGSSSGGASVSTSGGQTSTPAAGTGTGDTIAVDNFGDMPPQCIELLSSFLKAIEPTVSKVDWKTAKLSDFESLGTQFQTESDTFSTQSESAGCNKYNLTGSDSDQLKQVVQLAAAEAPGTVGFLTFMGSLSADASASGDSVPTDCNATIAAVETYLGKGTTMKDLTMTEVTKFGKLMSAVTTNCTTEQQQAFATRDDVTAFLGG
jgi:hypothetical protein